MDITQSVGVFFDRTNRGSPEGWHPAYSHPAGTGQCTEMARGPSAPTRQPLSFCPGQRRCTAVTGRVWRGATTDNRLVAHAAAAGQPGIGPTAAARCAGAKSSATRLAVGEIPSPSTMRVRRTSPGQAGVAPFRQAGCTGQPEFHQPSAPRAPERLLLGSQWHALQPKPGATWPETAAAVLGQPGFANLCQT